MLEDIEEKQVEKDEHLPGSVEYQGCDQGVSKAKGDRVRWGTTRQDCPALVSKVRSDKKQFLKWSSYNWHISAVSLEYTSQRNAISIISIFCLVIEEKRQDCTSTCI